MRLLEDRVFPFRGYHGCRSECRLRLFAPAGPGGAHVAVASELEDNPGTSVTNAAERLAWEVWRYLERPPGGLTWVEHYPDRCHVGGRPLLKEQFDLVTFEQDPATGRFRRPRWRRIPRAEAEALCDGHRL